ncbi:MAG TPA: single-stranded DNA-binding protein [Rhodanobacter sp.]|nr:single-stranded DNA-binding protein [Rhodanobacter sp.]
MSTDFHNEGNIGSPPEFREVPKGNDEPQRLLRLSVYFDHSVPVKDGYEDRGGFWAPVEWWHRDAEHFATLFQKGMRVFVDGHMERDDWKTDHDEPRTTYKVKAHGISILPYRIASVTMSPKETPASESAAPADD